jgi:hypothetical protein
MENPENLGHTPSVWENDTDPESFSNHTYRACVVCGETLWTCPKAYSGPLPHPKPQTCTVRK